MESRNSTSILLERFNKKGLQRLTGRFQQLRHQRRRDADPSYRPV